MGSNQGGAINLIRGIKYREPGGGKVLDDLLDQGHLDLDLDHDKTPEEDF